MGLKITPISFSASTTLKSADMNTNWTNVVSASNFDGIWNTNNNVNAQLTVEDATVNSVNVIRIRPSNSSPDRSIMLNGQITMDNTGNIVAALPNKVYSGTSITYKNTAFITGTGPGTYNLGMGNIGSIFPYDNTSAVSASVNSYDASNHVIVDCSSSGTKFFMIIF